MAHLELGRPKNGQKEVRFDLDQLVEEAGDVAAEQTVLSGVQERNVGFFEVPDRCVPFEAPPQLEIDRSGIDCGFPDVYDLAPCSSISSANTGGPSNGQVEDEGSALTTEKREPKRSLFAQHFGKLNPITDQRHRQHIKKPPIEGAFVNSKIQNLQLMANHSATEGADSTTATACTDARYALDPVHFDFATKCLRDVVSRQEQQLVKLFDALSVVDGNTSVESDEAADDILRDAKRNIQQIRALYLEQIQSEESGRMSWRFARQFVDPFSDGAWTLSPIRRVLDAVQQRDPASANADDAEIVRLALLWTVLLLHARPTFFRTFVNVGDFYCRLAELFLIGPEVFLDQRVRECVCFLLNTFLFDASKKGLLDVQLHRPIASLDAFMPFYEDLLQRFEDFSLGDDNFALLLLVGAYMNAAPFDGLLMAQTLWSPRRNVVRQMTVSEDKAKPLIDFLIKQRQRQSEREEEEPSLLAERARLLTNYATALRDGTVAAARNPALYAIASAELRHIVQQKTDGQGMEMLVQQFRTMLSDRLDL